MPCEQAHEKPPDVEDDLNKWAFDGHLLGQEEVVTPRLPEDTLVERRKVLLEYALERVELDEPLAKMIFDAEEVLKNYLDEDDKGPEAFSSSR